MRALIAAILVVTFAAAGHADPIVSSWFTDHSGSYARIYETPADEAAGNAVTTWSRGQGTQALPTYAGVHEVCHTDDWVYIRSTGLASYVMGPWQNGNFPNFPANQAVLYRLPLNPPPVPATRSLTGLGAIGYFVDGVAMFDSRDAFSYDHSTSQDETPMTAQDPAIDGDGIWNRDAYTNEGPTFDPGNAHQAGSNYHYHANPPGLRHQLGDSVTFDAATNTYSEVIGGSGTHSPILGWSRDGYPIYGPYGYDGPTDAGSTVTRMITGYQQRDGSNGSTNLPVTGRTTYPAWATRTYTHTFQSGPAVNGTYPLGHYIEDYAYKGDLGMTRIVDNTGGDFHLDEFNGRTCVTPEFPGGTYAYFTAILPDGTPIYPYNIGRRFYGDPVGGAVGTIPGPDDTGAVTVVFEGGPEVVEELKSSSVDDASGDVTVVWTAAEGGTYDVQAGTNPNALASLPAAVDAGAGTLTVVDSGRAATDDRYFYRAGRLTLAPFDDTGFDYGGGGTIVFTATFPTTPPLPPVNAVASITVGGVTATIISYDQASGVVELDFDDGPLAPGFYNAVLAFTPPGGSETTVTSTNQFEVVDTSGATNILLMIVDDWGIDSSPIDNAVPPATFLPNMPNLQALASSGLRFTRAYVNPTCSPMRASVMTGRYAHQTGVYTPQNAGAFSASELALPEAFTAAGSPYAMASMGKWHLGSGDTGYSTTGGWPEFYGITGGGVPNQPDGYSNWTKNTNGVAAAMTTYSTTDQVNEAVAFINRSETAGDPWFCWVAFNAPHTPFHTPPAGLAPPGGYSTPATGSTNLDNYLLMLEALDTEIGRLLASVDQSTTNIILIGDNGTPNQVVQAPFGNGNSKGDLYNGGIHVPMVAKGPALDPSLVGTTTDTLVHAVDLYTTLLELGGIDPATVPGMPATALAQSTSIVPILTNTDTADRCVVAEGGAGAGRGRAIITNDYPDFKMIIFGDPEDATDVPTIEFYYITADINEQSPLYSGTVTTTPGLSGVEQLAYDACLAKDAALGGGYSDGPAGSFDVLYIELPNPGSPTPVPGLTRPNGNPINVTSCTVTGAGGPVTATVLGRLDAGSDLANEADDAAARYWVKVTVPEDPPYSTAHVVFPNRPTDGATREYDSVSILVKP